MDAKWPTKPMGRRSGLRMLLVLVACAAACSWAWRDWLRSSPASPLRAAIREGSEADRISAMEQLWQYPADQARVAVPSLVEAARDPSEAIRVKAIEDLAFVFQRAEEAAGPTIPVDALLAASKDPSAGVRCAATRAYGAIYRRPDPALPSFGPPRSWLTPPREVIRALKSAADDPDPGVRAAALEAISDGLVDRKAALAALIQGFKDGDDSVRSKVARMIGPFSKDSREACRLMASALADRSSSVRIEAALADIPTGTIIPVECLPDLIAALDDRTLENIRVRALLFLEQIGPKAGEAIPAVARLAPSGAVEFPVHPAYRTLGAIAPGSQVARERIPGLLARLESSNLGPAVHGHDRVMAAQALVTYTWDERVVTALREALKDPDPDVRSEASKSLGSRNLFDDAP